jgi:hypothetical protein
MPGVIVLTCHPNYGKEAQNRITGQRAKPYLKNNQRKGGLEMWLKP